MLRFPILQTPAYTLLLASVCGWPDLRKNTEVLVTLGGLHSSFTASKNALFTLFMGKQSLEKFTFDVTWYTLHFLGKSQESQVKTLG